MSKFFQRFLLLITFLAIAGWISPATHAQMIKVGNLVVQSKAQKGQARELVEFTNVGKEAFRARVYTAPFTYNKNGLETLKSSPNDLTPYLTFSPRELVLEPNQTRTIRLNARFAPNVPDGEYRALMYIDQLNEIVPGSTSKTVTLKTRLGVTVYILKGEVFPGLTVQKADFDATQERIQLLVSNKGLATARPKINWRLTQAGKEIAKGELKNTTIVAEGERLLIIAFPPKDMPLTAGNYQLSGQLEWTFPTAGNIVFDVPLNISKQAVEILEKNQSPKSLI